MFLDEEEKFISNLENLKNHFGLPSVPKVKRKTAGGGGADMNFKEKEGLRE